MKLFIVFFGFSLMFISSCFASAQGHQGQLDTAVINAFEQGSNEVSIGYFHRELDGISDLIMDQEVSANSRLLVLENFIMSQSLQINELRRELSVSNNANRMTFEVWAGMMLASVAIILTALAIAIAIFSFFGYKKIISSSNQIATNKAAEVTGEIVKERIHETTKVELVRLFEDEKLDDFLLEAAGKVIYRGISIPGHDRNSGDSGEVQE